MKKITLFIVFISSSFLFSQTYVPDDNFEQALIDLGYDTLPLDDYVPTANINTVTSLDVSEKNIADLTGIEDFVALTDLNVFSNVLTSLDITNNTALTTLFCATNLLTSLDVSQNTALIDLTASYNSGLNSIDVSQNTALTNLTIIGGNLSSIDVSQNTLLQSLNLPNNQLTSLDVSQNTDLIALNFYGNQLTSIDISQNTALTNLFCFNNQLTNINVSQNTALQNFRCNNNQLTSLDVSQNTSLTKLKCQNNALTSLNVKNGNNSNVTIFDATGNPNLTCIQVDDEAYSTSNWTDIDPQSFFSEACSPNQTYIPGDNFEQALIDLGYDDVLDDYVVTANINTVTSLDVSDKNIADLTGLEDFVALTSLTCYDNQLTVLDVSNNTALEWLHCNGNSLTSLDVSANTVLATLYCAGNSLTSLDVSTNAVLIRLGCNVNQLTSLDVRNGNNTNFVIFNATSNPNLTCIQVDDAAYSTANWTNIDPQSFFSETCNSIQTYIPDDNFEQALIDLGYDDVIDDYVITANINTVTSLDVSNKNIENLTGIEDFVALTNLNISNNTLTSLDITNNLDLVSLICNNNQLTALDLSQNLALIDLQFRNNLITTIDPSQNLLLEIFDSGNNQLISLDVSTNPNLDEFYCDNNSLISLNIKNGNNTNISSLDFDARNNTELICIEVDDSIWSTNNWTYIDPQTSFSEDCNLGLNDNLISRFNVYPNPTQNSFKIKTKTPISRVIIYNTLGKKVLTFNNQEFYKVASLTKGMYFISIKTGQKTVTKKLIIN